HEEVRETRLLPCFRSGTAQVECEDTTVTVPRQLAFCRFPLVDGPDNPKSSLCAAVSTTALFLRQQRPTMVACSAGISRSVAVASAALAIVSGRNPDYCLSVPWKGSSLFYGIKQGHRVHVLEENGHRAFAPMQ